MRAAEELRTVNDHVVWLEQTWHLEEEEVYLLQGTLAFNVLS